jgi:hypothetical protein
VPTPRQDDATCTAIADGIAPPRRSLPGHLGPRDSALIRRPTVSPVLGQSLGRTLRTAAPVVMMRLGWFKDKQDRWQV